MKFRNLSNIFEGDSDSDVDVKTDNEYAKNYNVWRKKEELNKLKTKYGEGFESQLVDESSSSSEDDEEGIELTEQIEKDFFKTLACLKNKDPRIYDDSVKFFDDKDDDEVISKKEKKKKKDAPMYIKDYERNLIIEKGGILSDEEDEVETRPRNPTYIEEQNQIKKNLKNALSVINEEADDDWGGLFKERKKTKEEKEKDEADYKKWLSGREQKIEDKEVETELMPLKEYWNKPDLDVGEKFLRDYILNKKFMDQDDKHYIPTYDEIVHDSDQDLSVDEETIEKQEEFEHKYNFRFEEPDQEFIKRYPRTIESSVRKKDDKRKLKRKETTERKKKEKEEKMRDLKKLQELKRKEIEEKLEKLREITGNDNLGFTVEDIEGDFDPDAYDKRMKSLFDEEYYEGPEDVQKPEFPDIDKELEIENWERYEGEAENDPDSTPHCEDDNFIMDCDYDPHASTQNELIERSKGKKKRKRKSKFAEAVSKPKPKFDPNDKNYEQYFEEYYKLDCEDIIGDIPCRFKYRKVVPNDFGLSVEEILLAKERELNKWCSLKKAVQIRPDHIEKYDQIAYKRKGQNVELKKRVLPSLFVASEDDKQENSEDIANKEKTSKVKGRKRKDEHVDLNEVKITGNQQKTSDDEKEEHVPDEAPKTDTNKKKKKKKQKKKTETSTNDDVNKNLGSAGKEQPTTNQNRKNVDRKRKNPEVQNGAPRKKFKKNESRGNNTPDCPIPDARLKAYGIKPKKFKNKLKYGNK